MKKLISFALAFCPSLIGFANPQGLSVQSGSAVLSANGAQLNVTVSQNALLNWNSFNIASGESTVFHQPSTASIAWNRIGDANPSQIFGNLQANGVIVLVNPAGFYFGPNAVVSAAGLLVSTASAAPIESSAGLFWQFTGAPPRASIINYGLLSAGRSGSLFLVAEKIENHGELRAPEGSIGLFAGQDVQISSRPDGRGLSARVELPEGSIDNAGRIVANAGTVALHAKVVNQNGLIQADSVQERNGVNELVAAERVTLGANSITSARGDRQGTSDGGQIKIQSAGAYTDTPSAKISVAGGEQAGDGGQVELSAPQITSVHAQIDGSALPQYRGGRLLIDPTDIVLGSSGTGSIAGGQVHAGDPPTTLTLDVNSAFVGFSQIDLQASRNIQIAPGTLWDLLSSTGVNDAGSVLRLEAGNDITLGSGASILAGESWSVRLEAGRDLNAADRLTPGTGSISFLGTSLLQSGAGDIRLAAGKDVSVASGAVRTTAGGNIDVQALAGSINTGTKANGFLFRPTGYSVDPDLGGITTANGGNVSLNAGWDVTSFLPVAGGTQTDSGSGAFGPAPGNVTIQAGRDVSGHFVVRNGTGTIAAGRDAGTSGRLLALSLVSGGWDVTATHNILLQEARNPNGIFNNTGFGNSATKHFFDYSPEAFLNLRAGNSVQLRGTGLPRYDNVFEQGITPIYPGSLTLSAGAGGVLLGNDVSLFPSPQGNLQITTTDGGVLAGTKPGELVQLVVSDSGKTQYRALGDFGLADHAAVPGHQNDTEPIRVAVAGDLTGIVLGVPKRAEIQVGGSMINSRFDGQNLHDTDVTRITVAGDILNRNEFTSLPVSAGPPLDLFDLAYPPLVGSLSGLRDQLFYNAKTHQLTFQGRMTGDQLQALTSLSVRSFDANGVPIVAANGEPVTHPVQILDSALANQLYAASQDVPLGTDTGYRLGGGGRFEIQARNVDLGATAGIVSQGPRSNPALAQLFTRGADLSLTLSGDLDMFSSKIASLNGGSITLLADGKVNVGSRDFTTSDAAARGIFTVDDSDVTVVAHGDINVNGSRIAAYDGGNTIVRSLEGNIDAGTGASGAATVEKIYVDPVSKRISTYAPTIPGSGILATTFPPSLDPAFPKSNHSVGDILVETPRGNIVASAGGVVQIPLNGSSANSGTVTLRAGSKDADGHVVFEGNIDASGSGVIGTTVNLEASGSIRGLVFARQNIELSAQQNVNVTALAQGNVSVSAAGNVSGTIIGVGSVNASGATVDAALLSQNISASGNVTSSQVGFGQANAAGATSQSLQNDEPSKAVSTAKTSAESDDNRSQKRVKPRLAKTSGRVTIISPKIP